MEWVDKITVAAVVVGAIVLLCAWPRNKKRGPLP